MSIALPVVQIVLSLALPVLTLWFEKRSRFVRAASPVVVCYAAGMLLGNLPFVDFPDEVSLNVCNITVALAIPLLLFSVNIASWMRLAGKTVLASSMAMVAAVTGAAVAYTVCSDWLAESPKIAGMLVGVYVGGTPNMAAIGTAVHVESETFILLNAADMVVSFGYLLFILTIAPRVLARFLPAFQKQAPGRSDADGGSLSQRPTPASAGVAILAAMVIVAKQAANVRSGPSENLDTVAQLPRGATVDAQSRSGEWFKVAAEGIDGTGWVHQDVLRLATEADLTPVTLSTPSPTRVAATALPTATNPPPSITPMVYDSPVQMVVVAREAANIRSEPADEGDILGSVVRGAMVVVYEARDGWYRVRAEDLEGFGWIYGELLSPDPLPD